jgi:hypothetical protein
MSGDAAGGLALIEEGLRGLRGLYPESNELILGAVINRGRCRLALQDLAAAQLDFEEASAIANTLELGPTARLRLNADLEMAKTPAFGERRLEAEVWRGAPWAGSIPRRWGTSATSICSGSSSPSAAWIESMNEVVPSD